MSSIIDQYKFLHAQGQWFHGTAIKGHVDELERIIKHHGAVHLLDYGCGKARYWNVHKIHERFGVPFPTLYDPGLKQYSAKPEGTYDGVICVDVLEHVENPLEVLEELKAYADKFLFLDISVQHSAQKKRLPDGRPLHITVHPPQWWRERVTVRDGCTLYLSFDAEG